MDTNKHTSGPWTLTTVETSCGICHKIGPFPWKNGKQNHACIYVNYASHNGTGEHEAELLANARLIAAAPELLENLVVILECLRLGYNANECVNEIENAMAVILEATNSKQ